MKIRQWNFQKEYEKANSELMSTTVATFNNLYVIISANINKIVNDRLPLSSMCKVITSLRSTVQGNTRSSSDAMYLFLFNITYHHPLEI